RPRRDPAAHPVPLPSCAVVLPPRGRAAGPPPAAAGTQAPRPGTAPRGGDQRSPPGDLPVRAGRRRGMKIALLSNHLSGAVKLAALSRLGVPVSHVVTLAPE